MANLKFMYIIINNITVYTFVTVQLVRAVRQTCKHIKVHDELKSLNIIIICIAFKILKHPEKIM